MILNILLAALLATWLVGVIMFVEEALLGPKGKQR